MNDFVAVKLNFLLMYDEIFLDIYLKINESKYIKYTDEEYESKAVLEKLKQRNVEDVYLRKEDHESFAKNLSQEQEEKQKKKFVDSLDNYSKDYNLIKDLFNEASLLEEKKAEKALKFNKHVVDNVKQFNNLSKLFKNYYANNSNSLVKKHITMLTAYSIMKEFINISDIQIETMIMAINLSDILLTEEEFWESYKDKEEISSEKILNHGVDVIEKLPKANIFNNMKLVQLLKFHHEKPDGSGYPFGVNHTHFNIFHIIYYLSDQLSEKIIKRKMKSNSFEVSTLELVFENSKYGDKFNEVLSIMQKLFVGDDNA